MPPLDLLIFFEAAYRIKSFTGCAGELNVSQAAVSKRIRQLEDWVGEALFVRQGRRLKTTESGDRLYHSVGVALEFLSLGLENLREAARRPLSIGAHTVVGMLWLVPQLQQFGLSASACPTRLTTSDDTATLLSGKNDLLLMYGTGVVPGWKNTLLLHEELTPVASPELAKALKASPEKPFASLLSANGPPILNYVKGAADWVDWKVWLKSMHIAAAKDFPIARRSTYSQTIGEAIQGKGIALGSVALLKSELEAGRLVRLGKEVLKTGRGYHLCHDEKVPLSAEARNLAQFLEASAATSR